MAETSCDSKNEASQETSRSCAAPLQCGCGARLQNPSKDVGNDDKAMDSDDKAMDNSSLGEQKTVLTLGRKPLPMPSHR